MPASLIFGSSGANVPLLPPGLESQDGEGEVRGFSGQSATSSICHSEPLLLVEIMEAVVAL